MNITSDTRHLTTTGFNGRSDENRIALWRTHLTAKAKNGDREAPRKFLSLMKGQYPDSWQQWRQLRRQRFATGQQWRLVGGPLDGCVFRLSQQGMLRHIRITCPSQQAATLLREKQPLIEKICSGAWLTLSVTIEIENDYTLYP